MRSPTRLTAVEETEVPEIALPPQPAQPAMSQALASLMFLTMKQLSAKSVVALAALIDLAIVASAFVLWLMVIANPSQAQLVGVGLYGVFVLAVIWWRGRHARRE
jgi:hypothetical protein